MNPRVFNVVFLSLTRNYNEKLPPLLTDRSN